MAPLTHPRKSVVAGSQPLFARDAVVDEPRGSAKYPLSDEQVSAKFLTLARPVLGGESAEVLVGLVGTLENLTGLDELVGRSALPPTDRRPA